MRHSRPKPLSKLLSVLTSCTSLGSANQIRHFFNFAKDRNGPNLIDLSSNSNAATLGQYARTSAKTVAGFHSAAGRTFSRRLSAQVSASRGRSGLHGTLRHHSGRAEVCRRWAACAAYLPQFNATIRCRSTLGSASKSFATSRIFPVR